MDAVESKINLRIGNALEVLAEFSTQGILFDSIITDPPYELRLYDIGWDSSGIAYSADLWRSLYSVLKPGGFVVAFAHPRLYHRVAVSVEDAGFIIYPHLIWDYGNSGIPQPQNVSTLFDRASGLERKVVGHQRRSGYATALVTHGVQIYNSMQVPIYEKCVSEEAKIWEGYYYGLKTFKPCFETILLAQKPVARKKMIENIREFGTGPLYMGTGESWPKPVLHHPKAKKAEHQSNHPTVKPVSLMEELCRIACPMAGTRHILDPFAGTGTTGVAAQNLGMSCTLIELNPDLEAVIQRRTNLTRFQPIGEEEDSNHDEAELNPGHHLPAAIDDDMTPTIDPFL